MTERPVVVVSPLPHMLEPIPALIEDTGCQVRRLPAGPGFEWTPNAIVEHVGGADALVGIFPHAIVGPAVLDGASRLRAVISPIIGTETIDVEACTERRIVVGFGATAENYLGMAEANVMLIAALRKRLVPKMTAAGDGSWRPTSGVGNMVRNATIGLIGFGAIGQTTAARLTGWECRLVVHDPHLDPSVIAEAGAEPVDLDELLATAEVVVLAVTLTPETRGMIGEPQLRAMRPGAYLINTARGGLVDEAALLDALDSGHLAGAALDTWIEEGPDSRSPLRHHPLVIATGHNVGHSEELYAGHPIAARDNTIRALNGETPLHVRNPEVLPAWEERVARLDQERPLTPLTVEPLQENP
jgi:phosphoglycerate dehydrogenase-like enzyme